MKNKAIFLDRDGTINIDKHYLCSIDEFEFIPGSLTAMQLLKDAGFLLFVLTNQSGIARGYYSEKQYLILQNWLHKRLKEYGAELTASYYCPHLPDADVIGYRKNCDCRKPKTGMFKRVIDDFNIDISKSFAVGDRLRDCSICQKTKCHGYLLGTTENKNVIDLVKSGGVRNVKYSLNLYDAAMDICNILKK